MTPAGHEYRCLTAHPMWQIRLYRYVVLLVLVPLITSRIEVVNASECTACGYLAKSCNDSSAIESIDVCDATGRIQVDDIFCDDNECQCTDGHTCVSTVVGCSTLFQARDRRRCLGNVTMSQRFKQCATNQGLTTLNASNVINDWIYYKQTNKCQSIDCLAVKMFHHSGLVQCGHLLAVWKTNSSALRSDNLEKVTARNVEDTTYHFVVDGSRASDMKAGTFFYSVPWSSQALALVTKQANSTCIDSCYVLQTRNQPNGTCDGWYLQFDASVQFANSDEYVMSSLSWGIWCAVAGSVAAAIASIVIIGVVVYRYQHMDMTPTFESGEDGGLLEKLDDLRSCSSSSTQCASTLVSASPSSERGILSTNLCQRAAPDITEMESRPGWAGVMTSFGRSER